MSITIPTTTFDAIVSKIAIAVENVWDVIGEDYTAACDAQNEEITNRFAVSECVHHLDSYGGDADAYTLWQELANSHPYHVILLKVSEKCKLV
jgi:hypothetical protein